MFLSLMAAMAIFTLAVGYAQQRLYPHQPNVPLWWWIAAAVAFFGWLGLLDETQSYNLPEMVTSFLTIMASPGAAFANLVPTWIDGALLLLGLLVAVLTILQILIAWPLGALLSVLLLAQALGFFGGDRDQVETWMQIFFVVTQVYGWIYWFKFSNNVEGKRSNPFLSLWDVGRYPPLSAAARLKHVTAYDLAFASIIVLALAVVFLNFVGDKIPGEVSQHGILIGASIVAQMLNARKHWFGWGLWAIANAIGAGVYAVENNPGMVLLSVLFFVLSVVGLINWYNEAMAQRANGLRSEIV